MRDKQIEALEALKEAYKQHGDWMRSHARKLELGEARYLEVIDNAEVNKCQETAQDLHHRANNLDALIAAYERICSKA